MLIQMQAPSREPDVSSRRFQAKKAPWCPSDSALAWELTRPALLILSPKTSRAASS